ncbi:fungal-specific transcription factor domain-containing protein [Aspergillus coremiiformis]|uniref:Fungal-specific transcription factor domain-containing protein n=1 Tax=Aspergillus coremiiformis TaxID=138285 RepID=A0A5N6ZAG0_9EURO|nr:fungal-specific transcription factor domain-containing protein [Aspergillus coremiiformis]
MAENAYPYDTAVVRELLKNKRKTRGIRSCFPCRHRKVRCDGKEPCSNCVRRNHSELCRVPTPSSSEANAARGLNLDVLNQTIEESRSSGDPILLISKLEKIEEQITSLKADLHATVMATSQTPYSANEGRNSGQMHTRPASKSPGRCSVEDSTGSTVYLGSKSDTPPASGCPRPSAAVNMMLHDTLIDQAVPRAYPFTDMWGPEPTLKSVCETLPDDSDTIRYWQAYQSTVHPFYPALVTVDQFGPALFAFLDRRAASPEAKTTEGNEPNFAWLALLFAVLACGVQFSDDPIKERDLRSKVLLSSSFQCLRMSNLFSHTKLDQIQAMALIGYCLRNNLDTNNAWILMGTTIRLAQSIGLHEASLSLPASEQFQRNKLWWALVWQDTFLSFTYDRPQTTIARSCPIPYRQQPEGLSFQESIFTVCNILLNKVRQETAGNLEDLRQSALKYKRQLEEVWDDAAPFLTDKARCTSLQDHLERLALGVHLGYGICRLNRVYLNEVEPDSPFHDSAAAECTKRAMQAIENFLDLHRFSASVCRSWAFVHNVVSCAIMLKDLRGAPAGDHQNSEILVQRLIAVLEREEKESEWCDGDTNARYSGPYSWALKALRETYQDARA